MSEKIFISGSAVYQNNLPDMILKFLDVLIKNNKTFLIGDCYGVDTLVQEYLKSKNYKSVVIYHSGKTCRNNLNNWPQKSIISDKTGRDFYTEKDIAMIKNADAGLAIWNGHSKGTYNNIKNMQLAGKTMAIFRLDENKFI